MTGATVAGLLLILASSVCGDDSVSRKLNVTREWETSCMNQLDDNVTCSTHPLAHVTATSDHDVLHLLVSLWEVPSCLLLRTPLDTQLSINWTVLLNDSQTGAVTAGSVLEAYGLSLDQLIEFDDPKDTADLTHASATQLRAFSLDMSADARQLDVSTATNDDGDTRVVIKLKAPPQNAADWNVTGSITFKVEVLDTDRRTDELPHLQQTGNSLVVGVVLDKLETSSGFQHSRFGVQMTTVGNETQKLEVIESLDDEYTPGVFKLMSLSSSAADSGYLQWRPVAYTASEYTIEHSTTARNYSVMAATATAVSPLLRTYFGETSLNHQLNVTFGLSEDGWYKDAKYAAWELTMGLGAPPEDQFSLMVILLLAIGLGLPTVALVGGGVWMAVRRLRGQTAGAARLITEEE